MALDAGETTVSEAIRYDASGQTIATGSGGGSPVPSAWRYQGRLDLVPAGLDPLYDMSARFYTPASGTFSQLDAYLGTTHDPLSRNRYLYAHANPATLIDPSGHNACWLVPLAAPALVAPGVGQVAMGGAITLCISTTALEIAALAAGLAGMAVFGVDQMSKAPAPIAEIKGEPFPQIHPQPWNENPRVIDSHRRLDQQTDPAREPHLRPPRKPPSFKGCGQRCSRNLVVLIGTAFMIVQIVSGLDPERLESMMRGKPRPPRGASPSLPTNRVESRTVRHQAR